MQFGDYRIEVIPDCEFRLDGGAMFGVVPRNLWSKACPPAWKFRASLRANECARVNFSRMKGSGAPMIPPIGRQGKPLGVGLSGRCYRGSSPMRA